MSISQEYQNSVCKIHGQPLFLSVGFKSCPTLPSMTLLQSTNKVLQHQARVRAPVRARAQAQAYTGAPHARTHTRARTHTHHRSLASRSAPRLEPRSWCVCAVLVGTTETWYYF